VISYVRADHIGRPAFATNGTGAVVWSASYLPFGGVRVTTGTPVTARFPGQWFQSENGLHQNWMRDYDPTTGRYLQADPLGLIDGASVYGYARQSPMRWADPRGEDSVGGVIWVPLPPVFTPGTSEAADAGRWISELSRRYNPIDRFFQWCMSCPACRTADGRTIAVGTIGYRPLDNPSRPQHGITGPHYNIYRAQQNPNNCVCFWQRIGAVSPADLDPSAVPISPFVN
jgi:RHS repeat-associated protein